MLPLSDGLPGAGDDDRKELRGISYFLSGLFFRFQTASTKRRRRIFRTMCVGARLIRTRKLILRAMTFN